MRRMGYPVIRGQTFFSNSWAKAIGSTRNIHEAWRFARTLGLPVYVKPNSGSQGSGVCLVYDKREFYRAMRAVFAWDRVGIVQKQVYGLDYRVVVLDNKIISAYERIPLSVTGDGQSSILRLLKKKQGLFEVQGRDTRINFRDPRIKEKLKHQRLSFQSVPVQDQTVYLLDNTNLSTGGDAVDVTKQIHPGFKKIAVQLTRDMGLRLCGVDLMVMGEITRKPNKYWILEVNSAPGLDHYAQTGRSQEKIVEDLYLEVLKSME